MKSVSRPSCRTTAATKICNQIHKCIEAQPAWRWNTHAILTIYSLLLIFLFLLIFTPLARCLALHDSIPLTLRASLALCFSEATFCLRAETAARSISCIRFHCKRHEGVFLKSYREPNWTDIRLRCWHLYLRSHGIHVIMAFLFVSNEEVFEVKKRRKALHQSLLENNSSSLSCTMNRLIVNLEAQYFVLLHLKGLEVGKFFAFGFVQRVHDGAVLFHHNTTAS